MKKIEMKITIENIIPLIISELDAHIRQSPGDIDSEEAACGHRRVQLDRICLILSKNRVFNNDVFITAAN